MGEQDKLQTIHKVYDAFGHYTFNVVKTGKVVDNDFVHAFGLAGSRVSTFEGFEDSAAAVVAALTDGPD